jgi:D-alanyl-lipoteichoic acid acyltransferase DltB (MBOAT superfamily)
MLFTSINFAIFLPIVFIFYWFVTNKKLGFQNLLLLVSSYFFYASWDWRFLFLLIFSTSLDYFTGIKIEQAKNRNGKKIWLLLSIFINLGFLGVFKYYNFFADSFVQAISRFGLYADPWTLKIILPVGISFYTFHGLSYIFDIYNNKIRSERNIIDYAVFVSFFPLLVAGPIERATHLLPQIKKSRIFEYEKAIDGLKQILWGLFKKIVIADQCAVYANMAFNSNDYSGINLVLGAVFFAFQIYGDFSGYSDIAIGTARLFGIDLLRNFAFPYFSRDIAEFWRRWHMSLTSWFRDYIYIPLGGSRGGTLNKIRNIFIIFLVSGFWHGANWTFIFWGVLNAIYFLPLMLTRTNRDNLGTVAKGRYLPEAKEFINMFITFGLTTFAWIFFRAESLSQAVDYIYRIFSESIFSGLKIGSSSVAMLVIGFAIMEWLGRHNQYAIADLGIKWRRSLRWAAYYAIIVLILFFSGGGERPFIYFQF